MNNVFNRLVLLLMVIVLMASCMTSKRLNYLQQPDGIIPDYSDSLIYEDYRLRVGDKLYVRVYSTHRETNELFNGGGIYQSSFMMQGNSAYADLSSYTIQKDGTITMPLCFSNCVKSTILSLLIPARSG